jgi:broad specificity phosphatase PhoE
LHKDLKNAQITTSNLARTIQTVKHCPNTKCLSLSLLNEINAGICEGMTYEEIKEKYPEVSMYCILSMLI